MRTPEPLLNGGGVHLSEAKQNCFKKKKEPHTSIKKNSPSLNHQVLEWHTPAPATRGGKKRLASRVLAEQTAKDLKREKKGKKEKKG